MKKPIRKEVNKLARAFASKWDRDNWRQLAKYVLVNYTRDDDYKMPPYMGEAAWQAALRRRNLSWWREWYRKAGFDLQQQRASKATKPKSCKLVRGKVVCK
jgi:hypothetical protein